LAEAPSGKPQAIIIATGSEVDIAVKAWEKLVAEGVEVRLVSMPCTEWFDEQDAAYRANVLPREIAARVVVEAGVRQCWDRFLGEQGRFVGMETFGASAPYGALYKHFGITPEHVAAEVKAALGK
jgi:transketolase